MTGAATDIMDALLNGADIADLAELEALNALIYRDPLDAPDAVGREPLDAAVSVDVLDNRAQIRIGIDASLRRQVCLRSLADIAVRAVLQELERRQSCP